MGKIDEIFDSLGAKLVGATIKEDLALVLGNACESFGFEYYCLKTNLRLSDGDRKSLKITNYPTAWLQRYSESGYALIDPAAKHAIDHVAIASLENLIEGAEQSTLRKRFKNDARDMGIDFGITMPLRSPHFSGFLNFNCRDLKQNARFVNLSAHFSMKLSEALGQFCIGDDVSGGYHILTLREKHVLYWAASGKTAWETSLILNISQRTVVAHIVNSMNKLNCSNKYQMLSRVASLIDSDSALDEFRIEI